MNEARLTVCQDTDGSIRILVPSDLIRDGDASDMARVELATVRARREKQTGRKILVIRIVLSRGDWRSRQHSQDGSGSLDGPEVDDEGGMSEYRHFGQEWP